MVSHCTSSVENHLLRRLHVSQQCWNGVSEYSIYSERRHFGQLGFFLRFRSFAAMLVWRFSDLRWRRSVSLLELRYRGWRRGLYRPEYADTHKPWLPPSPILEDWRHHHRLRPSRGSNRASQSTIEHGNLGKFIDKHQ